MVYEMACSLRLGADVPSRRWVPPVWACGQWSCRGRFPLLSGCLRRPWNNSTHFPRDAGLWTISSTSSSYLAATGVPTKPLVPCGRLFGVSVFGCMWKNFSQCLREGGAHAVRNWKSGHYFYVLSLAVLFLRNAWLYSGYMYLVSSWRLLTCFLIFHVPGWTRVLRSILVLLSV